MSFSLFVFTITVDPQLPATPEKRSTSLLGPDAHAWIEIDWTYTLLSDP